MPKMKVRAAIAYDRADGGYNILGWNFLKGNSPENSDKELEMFVTDPFEDPLFLGFINAEVEVPDEYVPKEFDGTFEEKDE